MNAPRLWYLDKDILYKVNPAKDHHNALLYKPHNEVHQIFLFLSCARKEVCEDSHEICLLVHTKPLVQPFNDFER